VTTQDGFEIYKNASVSAAEVSSQFIRSRTNGNFEFYS